MAADEDRVVVAFDVDCFYAQAEEVRNPALRGKPVGVTQKYLVVTANYPAREAGVGKLMNTADAKRKCPELILVPGEDLGPYRAASQSILSVLSRYGPACRLGLDEVFVDMTQVVKARLAAGERADTFTGHVHRAGSALAADTQWRPQDLRAVAEGVVVSSITRLKPPAVPPAPASAPPSDPPAARPAAAADSSLGRPKAEAPEPTSNTLCPPLDPSPGGGGPADPWAGAAAGPAAAADASRAAGDWGTQAWVELVKLGSRVAWEARAAVLAETGFKCSAGIACNKALAKLASGLHKPNDQTVLPPPDAAAFLAPLHVRVLPGVGRHVEEQLNAVGVTTIAQLRQLPPSVLQQQVGARVAAVLSELAWGRDASVVAMAGPPKAITTEDSFKSCSTLAAAQTVLEVLLPDLLLRVEEDCREHQRAPATLTVKWRHRSDSNGGRTSASVPWPIPPGALNTVHSAPCNHPTTSTTSDSTQVPSHVRLLLQAAMGVLTKRLSNTNFCLTLINVGATNFKPLPGSGGLAQPLLHRFLLPKKRSNSDLDPVPPSPQQTTAAGHAVATTPPLSPAPLTSPPQHAQHAQVSCYEQRDNGWDMADPDATDPHSSLWSESLDLPPNVMPGLQAPTSGMTGSAPSSNGLVVAERLVQARRDYGSHGVQGLVPKSQERQLREQLAVACHTTTVTLGLHVPGQPWTLGQARCVPMHAPANGRSGASNCVPEQRLAAVVAGSGCHHAHPSPQQGSSLPPHASFGSQLQSPLHRQQSLAEAGAAETAPGAMQSVTGSAQSVARTGQQWQSVGSSLTLNAQLQGGQEACDASCPQRHIQQSSELMSVDGQQHPAESDPGHRTEQDAGPVPLTLPGCDSGPVPCQGSAQAAPPSLDGMDKRNRLCHTGQQGTEQPGGEGGAAQQSTPAASMGGLPGPRCLLEQQVPQARRCLSEQEAQDRELALRLQREEVEAARALQRQSQASTVAGGAGSGLHAGAHTGLQTSGNRTGTRPVGRAGRTGQAGRGAAGGGRGEGGAQQATLHHFFAKPTQ